MKLLTLGTETVEFTVAKFTRLINRNATAMGYSDSIPNPVAIIADPDTIENPHDLPNPESKVQFVHRKLVEMLIENVKGVEQEMVVEEVRKAAREKVDQDYG